MDRITKLFKDGGQMVDNIPRVKWDGTINWGHILVASSMLFGVFFAWSNLANKIQASEELRAKYLPQIDMVIKQVDVNKDRLDRLSDALVEVRKNSNDANVQFQKTLTDVTSDSRKTYDAIIEKINQISIDVAEIKVGLAAQDSAYRQQWNKDNKQGR